MYSRLVEFIRDTYRTKSFIPLHVPTFSGNEKSYVCDTIDSTFVSSVGTYVDKFEEDIQGFTGTEKAVATVNGTAALHTALYLVGVRAGDLVITQALSFVALCNVIHHLGAKPVFVDVSRTSLGLCPKALERFLEENAELDGDGKCRHKESKQTLRALVPMHTFGHPVELDELLALSEKWNIPLIEDAAEALGSYYREKHVGTLGLYGALSFNGNKIITTGGGGMLLCSSEREGKKAKHVTSTAKVPHPYEFYHDEPGFNFRMPNINAALGCAQMESLPRFLQLKRELAKRYAVFFEEFAMNGLQFVSEPPYARSNYWLNAVICPDSRTREALLKETNGSGVMTRPVWQLMNRLPMFRDAICGELGVSEWLESRLVNLPSTPPKRGETNA